MKLKVIALAAVALLSCPAFAQAPWEANTWEKAVNHVGHKLLGDGGHPGNIAFIVRYDSTIPNASANYDFSTVYVNYALLKYVASEDELAGILAHEIAHIVLQHTLAKRQHMIAFEQEVQKLLDKKRRSSSAWSALGAGIGGFISGQGAIPAAISAGSTESQRHREMEPYIKQLVLEEYQKTAFREYSQEYELEADKAGAAIMLNSGYNPEHFKNILMKISGDGALTSTHPPTQARLKAVDEGIILYSQLIEVIKAGEYQETQDIQRFKPIYQQSKENP